MQRTTVERRTVVHEIVCDRCGKEVRREHSDFGLMTSIGFEAGYASIFGARNRVEIDLCEPCVRDTLGTWLRVRMPEDTPLARMPDKFEPEVRGGEVAGRAPRGLGELVRSAGPADAEEAVGEPPPTPAASQPADPWVPIAQLFDRLADGATLAEIEAVFPAISAAAAGHALREAALRFPSHACFHRAVDVWTPRYPHER